MVFLEALMAVTFLAGSVFTYPDPSGGSFGRRYENDRWQWSGGPGYRVLAYTDNGPQTSDSNFVNPPAKEANTYAYKDYPPKTDYERGYSENRYPANEHEGDLREGLIGGLIAGLIIGKSSGGDYVGLNVNGHHLGVGLPLLGGRLNLRV